MGIGIDELIKVEVERSFDVEPPLHDPRAYLTRGRRARRRRRMVAGAGGLAIAVATIAVVAVGFGSDRLAPAVDRDLGPADLSTHPVRASTTLPYEPLRRRDCPPRWLGGCEKVGWLYAGTDGGLVRAYADIEVTGRYDDIYSDSYGGSSALEVRHGGQVSWILATWSRGDAGVSIEFGCPDPTRTFDQWVEESARRGMGGASPPACRRSTGPPPNRSRSRSGRRSSRRSRRCRRCSARSSCSAPGSASRSPRRPTSCGSAWAR